MTVIEKDASTLSQVAAFPKFRLESWDWSLFLHDGKVLSAPWNNGDPRHFPIRERVLGASAKTAIRWSVRAPTGRYFISFHPSPDYQKAVWVIGDPGKERVDYFGQTPTKSISLWTSGLHGEGMKEIGSIGMPSQDQPRIVDDYQHFGEVQWSPDCRHVSFIYKRVLYLAPA